MALLGLDLGMRLRLRLVTIDGESWESDGRELVLIHAGFRGAHGPWRRGDVGVALA